MNCTKCNQRTVLKQRNWKKEGWEESQTCFIESCLEGIYCVFNLWILPHYLMILKVPIGLLLPFFYNDIFSPFKIGSFRPNRQILQTLLTVWVGNQIQQEYPTVPLTWWILHMMLQIMDRNTNLPSLNIQYMQERDYHFQLWGSNFTAIVKVFDRAFVFIQVTSLDIMPMWYDSYGSQFLSSLLWENGCPAVSQWHRSCLSAAAGSSYHNHGWTI